MYIIRRRCTVVTLAMLLRLINCRIIIIIIITDLHYCSKSYGGILKNFYNCTTTLPFSENNSVLFYSDFQMRFYQITLFYLYQYMASNNSSWKTTPHYFPSSVSLLFALPHPYPTILYSNALIFIPSDPSL